LLHPGGVLNVLATLLCELIAEHFARLAADKLDQEATRHLLGPVRFLVPASPVIAALSCGM